MALAELATYQSRIHAEIVRGRLAGHGIEAILFDEGLSSLGLGALTPVRLMVDEADLDEAMLIVSQDAA